MLHDFNLKIVHQPGLRHTNVDALNRNPIGLATDDDDFNEETQDIGSIQTDTHGEENEIIFVKIGKET
jgi:hypothetical protein